MRMTDITIVACINEKVPTMHVGKDDKHSLKPPKNFSGGTAVVLIVDYSEDRLDLEARHLSVDVLVACRDENLVSIRTVQDCMVIVTLTLNETVVLNLL